MKTQLRIRTEYSFKWAYGPVARMTSHLKALGCEAAAITDRNSTFGHIQWAKHCKRNDIKPLFGVELGFISDLSLRNRRQNLFWFSLIAKNNAGLKEIYAAMEEASGAANFYYHPRLPFNRLDSFSQDVFILHSFSAVPDGSWGKAGVLLPSGW